MRGDIEIEVKELVKDITVAAVSRADEGLNILRNAALEVLGKDGTGRRYGKHIASAPKQPPAPYNSNLRRNWQQQKFITGNTRITLRIESEMFYADFLEYGTRKMAKRPYHKRIRKKAIPEIRELFSDL